MNENLQPTMAYGTPYEQAVLQEMSEVKSGLKGFNEKLSAIELQLAAINLVELKLDVRTAKETLNKYDLEKLSDKVDKSEKFVTRAMAILAFIQIIVGILALFKTYIFPQ